MSGDIIVCGLFEKQEVDSQRCKMGCDSWDPRDGSSMPRSLKPGDVVRLQSSGPKMTVSADIDDNLKQLAERSSPAVMCIWFDDDNILHKDLFTVDQLKFIHGTQPDGWGGTDGRRE